MQFKRREQWNWRHFLICFSVAIGLMGFSYPASIIGTTLAQPSFYEYMHLLTDKGELRSSTNSLIGAMSGVFQAGGFFGVFLVTWVMERWGRKPAVIVCSVIGLVGGALVCAAQNVSMFIFFKFVAGMSSWGFVTIIPVYTSELAPPALRGLFVGMDGLGIALGYAVATYMGLAFYHSTNSSTQWRGPYGVGLVFTALPLFVVLFIAPESPRWLLMAGRADDAKKVVRDLHRLSRHNEEQHFAMVEFYQMQKQIEYDRTMNATYWQMFRKPSYRKRVIMTVGYAILGQSTAILVINNYGPLLYSAMGYGVERQLALQCGWITCGIAGNLTGALIMDKVGRKPLMIFGIAGCLVCLCVEAAMVATYASPVPEHPNKAGLSVAIAAFYLFVYVYGCGVDVAGITFWGEVYPNHIRAKGLALTVASQCLSSLVYLEAASTAFANIGWKYYLVFISVCAAGVVWISIVLPETKGVPLEEVAALFGDQDEVVVFTDDIQLGATEGELVVEGHHRHHQVKEKHDDGTPTPNAKDEMAATHRETVVLDL